MNVILPPKKLLGNRDPEFVERRREQLDFYLKQVIGLLGKNPPPELAIFLNLYDYEILFILRKMSVDIFEHGDEFLEQGEPFPISPYQVICSSSFRSKVCGLDSHCFGFQLFGIKERMKMALPTLNSTDKREDISHLIEFCTNVKSLNIIGSDICLPKSTIIPNHFPMDLSPFKSLLKLTLKLINITRLTEVSNLYKER